ncbi:MAG: DUF4190 domain-containing protein [Sumerlaeia bacterium]
MNPPMPPATPSPYGSYPPPYPMRPPTSSLAISSLILGCMGFLCSIITGLPALILGIAALVKIRRSEGALGGSGLAVAGIVLSFVTVVLSILPVMVAIAVPGFLRARQQSRLRASEINLATLDSAIYDYHLDHGVYPQELSQLDNINNVSSLSIDPFLAPPDNTFDYWTNGQVAILRGAGPDGVRSYPMETIAEAMILDVADDAPDDECLRYIYDPMNGIQSQGDLLYVNWE